jgi:hypothetical protein
MMLETTVLHMLLESTCLGAILASPCPQFMPEPVDIVGSIVLSATFYVESILWRRDTN